MKRLVWPAAALVAALATMALAATASADVPRHQIQTYTFTAIQPAEDGQWANVWIHNFTVTVNPCDGTFTGTAEVFDPFGSLVYGEFATGSFGAGTVSMDVVSPDGFQWSLAGAPTDNSTVTVATSDPVAEFKVSPPLLTNSTNYKNHGDYVNAGDAADAAHSCIGMPIR
jgi:hypothetical protein